MFTVAITADTFVCCVPFTCTTFLLDRLATYSDTITAMHHAPPLTASLETGLIFTLYFIQQ
nr:MAG TPA: hypothetical protein [Caudoviricetes sp.]